MLRILIGILEQTLGTWPNGHVVHAAFEWPRHASGWMLPEVVYISSCARRFASMDVPSASPRTRASPSSS
eukprot:13804169-Heterocapsa_arctica.AAC.1